MKLESARVSIAANDARGHSQRDRCNSAASASEIPPRPGPRRAGMRLLILSDLHLEVSRGYCVPRALDVDAVVLAGDIDRPGWRGIRWAARAFARTPVLYVPGNHEYFRQRLDIATRAMQDAAADCGVYLLDRSALVLGSVRFLGCTLWTDFCLNESAGAARCDQRACLNEAQECMPDYRFVRMPNPHAVVGSRGALAGRWLDSADTLEFHRRDRAWLQRALAEPFEGPTVVITHHAPHRQSIAPRFVTDRLSGAFASHLPSEFFAVPSLWVHGHTHDSFDYRVGPCRIVCNPRGYALEGGTSGNVHFEGALVVQV